MTVVPKVKENVDRVTSPSESKDGKRPKGGLIEFPSNPSSLSISELKELCVNLGISMDGCFEKQDFIDKLTAYKKSKTSGTNNVKSPTHADSKNATYTDNFPKELPNTLAAVKIISIGAQEVGKSCLIKRYCEGRFVKRYIPTIGVDYGVKVVDTKAGSAAVHFFDLSGNEDFKMIRLDFYSNAQGCIIVFDVNDKESFKLLSNWESEAKAQGVDVSKLHTIVIGNKTDVGHREVPETEGHKWAKTRGYPYFDCSASSGANVNQAFDYLFNAVVKTAMETRKAYGIS